MLTSLPRTFCSSQFKANKFRLCGQYYSPSDDADSDDEDVYNNNSSYSSSSHHSGLPASAFPQAFDLDSQCADGHVALIFTSATSSAVYFQDVSTRWYYVAPTFSAYHRLMMMHLGVHGWLYAFTPAGLSSVCKQWLGFLAPQRLAMDVAQGRSNREQWLQRASTATIAGGHPRTSSRPSGGQPAGTIDLAHIDDLAQSVLAVQKKPAVAKLATAGTEDEEEEE